MSSVRILHLKNIPQNICFNMFNDKSIFVFFKCSILAYIQSEYFALYFLDEECKPMTLLSCDLYDGYKYINDIFKVISK